MPKTSSGMNTRFGHDDRTGAIYHEGGEKPRKHRPRFGPRFNPGLGGRPWYADQDGDVDMSVPGTSRRERFNPYRNNKRHKNGRSFNPGLGGRPWYADQDGDVDMSVPGTSRRERFNPYRNNKRHKNGRRYCANDNIKITLQQTRPNKNDDSDRVWYKITIPCGKKLERQFIFKSIASHCRTSFVPFNFQYENSAAIFYVDGLNTALSIKDVSCRITTPDGFKMPILMMKSISPIIVVNPEVEEAIKACVSRHYDAVTHSLNLSRFHLDPGLSEAGIYIPLHKPKVFSAVVKVIKENIPEIEKLDLSQNKLYSLDILGDLVPECIHLTALNLRDNMLRRMSVLSSIKGINLVEIILVGNPLCDDFRYHSSYVSAVQKQCSSIIRLDEQELPAPITFDLGPETLPASKGSFFPAQDVEKLVKQFLEAYFSIYDFGDRKKLLDAYHDEAMFSMTAVTSFRRIISDQCLQEYIPKSRNLIRITDNNYRFKFLKQGRLNIVSALNNFPRTLHDPNSFTVDVSLVSPTLMSFTACGVFKEVGSEYRNAPLRSFSRSFVVAPEGSGFVICNETLFITNASTEQVKAFKFAPPIPSPSPAPSGDKTVEEKQMLATTFSNETGMNLEFSAKCLEEHEWDYFKAMGVFRELHSLGKIPPQAFVK